MPVIKLNKSNNYIKIYIDDLLHLCLKTDELIGIQSWLDGDNYHKYSIEFVLKNGNILSEYDDVEKWKKILELLDKQAF